MLGTASSRAGLILLFSTALPVGLSTSTCYYPNSEPSTDDVQCEPGDDSACCGPGAICLDNGLCLSQAQPFGISRGSCTDPGFNNGKCTRHCTDVQKETGVSIVLYNVTEDSKYLYCCNSIVNRPEEEFPACDSGEPFEIEPATIMPGVALLDGYVRASDMDNGTTCDDTNNADSSNHNVAIGAGVGVPLGVIALAAIAWAIYERRQRKQLLQTTAPTISTVGPFHNKNKPLSHPKPPSENQVPFELPTPSVDR